MIYKTPFFLKGTGFSWWFVTSFLDSRTKRNKEVRKVRKKERKKEKNKEKKRENFVYYDSPTMMLITKMQPKCISIWHEFNPFLSLVIS